MSLEEEEIYMAFESTYAGVTNQPQNNFGGNTQPSYGAPQYGAPQQMGYGQPIPQQAGAPVPAQAQPKTVPTQVQPVQQQVQAQAQPQVPASYGTTVDRVVVNKQWASGSKSWMAVVDITTDAELFLNGLNAWVNPDGVNIIYPGEGRMQNGQPVVNQQGKKVVNHYYTPYVKDGYNGYAEMAKILAPLAQSAVQTGQGVSDNPSDMGHSNKMFPAPQTVQGAPRAYGSAYVKGMPTRIYGIFVMPVYDENGTCTCRLAMPSRPKKKNGQPVMKDGKQEYTQYVILGKSSREEVTNIVGQAVYDALVKAQQQVQ